MREVGVRELKARASEIVREVREDGARYVVTLRGKPAAVLSPVGGAEADEVSPAEERRDPWAEFHRLGDLIDASWGSEKTSTEVISEMRR